MPNDNDKSPIESEDSDTLEAGRIAADKETEDKPKAKTDESKSASDKAFPEEYVKDLRKENANYRRQAKEAQDKIEAVKEEAKKSLDETKRLQTAWEQRIVNAELKAAAAEEGLVDMDAFKMVDLSSIKVADNGDITGVKELVGNLKKEKPYLFKPVTTSKHDAGAPPADKNNGEKPAYKTPQEFKDAKGKFLASLR